METGNINDVLYNFVNKDLGGWQCRTDNFKTLHDSLNSFIIEDCYNKKRDSAENIVKQLLMLRGKNDEFFHLKC